MHGAQEQKRELTLLHPVLELPHVPAGGDLIDGREHEIVGGEIARPVAPEHAALRVRSGGPDREIDQRLDHHADQPDGARRAVLHLDRERDADVGSVEIAQEAHGGDSVANTRSITSSIGGSSTTRSTTGRSASSRAVTLGVSALGTRSTARSPARETTSP